MLIISAATAAAADAISRVGVDGGGGEDELLPGVADDVTGNDMDAGDEGKLSKGKGRVVEEMLLGRPTEPPGPPDDTDPEDIEPDPVSGAWCSLG